MTKIRTFYIGDLKTEAEHLKSGSKLMTEAPEDNNGKGEMFSPTDLFATSLGSCMMTIMGIAAQAHGFSVDGKKKKKKYSPVGELSDFAAQICEALYKSGDCVAAVCDRDSVIACAGVPKKELVDKRISSGLADIMDSRKLYSATQKIDIPFTDSDEMLYVYVAAPIIAEGDVMGCVVFTAKNGSPEPTEVQIKLASAVASFLGKQMET